MWIWWITVIRWRVYQISFIYNSFHKTRVEIVCVIASKARLLVNEITSHGLLAYHIKINLN